MSKNSLNLPGSVRLNFLFRKLAIKLFTAICICSLAQVSVAQTNPPQLTPAVRADVVNSLSKSLLENYIFEDTAVKMSDCIKGRLKDQRYEPILNQNEFARALTSDLRSVYNDAHLSITFNVRGQLSAAEKEKNDAPGKRRRNLQKYRQQNFGFKKLEVLSGNIGYVSFDQFYGFNDSSKEVVDIAFSFLKNTNALIIDLRNNGGGSPDMAKYISSFLLPPGTQLSSFYERRTNQTETAFTYQPSVPVSFADRPIYILAGRRSFSGAEMFSYDLQSRQRATIVGETTGGGAHAVGPIDIGNGFTGLIPYSRAISPVTGTNWENVGVKPDIRADSDKALDVAVLHFYDLKIRSSTDLNSVEPIKWARDMLNAKLNTCNIDGETMRAYAGDFNGKVISIENGIPYFSGRDGKRSKLVALTRTIFKIEGVENFKIEFLSNSDGGVDEIAFIFEDGFTTKYKRKK